MTYHVRITPSGRMSLPAELRKRLGLGRGGDLVVEETEDGVILRTVAQVVANAQELARRYTAGKDEFSVDDFLAQRRNDSGE